MVWSAFWTAVSSGQGYSGMCHTRVQLCVNAEPIRVGPLIGLLSED